MSTETTNKKIKIDNGTTFGKTYTDKAIDERLQGLVSTATFTPVKEKANNSLQKPAGLTKTKLVGVGTNGQENIEIGDNLTLANGKLSATGGVESGISVIELTDKNGTIASAQLSKINSNPQNFAFKYNGKILSFTSSDSTTYKYCNNNTSSSDNNVMTTSTLLTITSSTGAYTIAENVHNIVANSIHPANGGDLTNIQVGSKVYSIPSGGSNIEITTEQGAPSGSIQSSTIFAGSYETGTVINNLPEYRYELSDSNIPTYIITQWYFDNPIITRGDVSFYLYIAGYQYTAEYLSIVPQAYCIKGGTISNNIYLPNPTCKQRIEIRIK